MENLPLKELRGKRCWELNNFIIRKRYILFTFWRVVVWLLSYFIILIYGGMYMKEIDRVIIKGSVARQLLKLGFTIIDVRPQKQENGQIDFSRNVLVFRAQDGLGDAVEKLLYK
jgi:hypothetical protein